MAWVLLGASSRSRAALTTTALKSVVSLSGLGVVLEGSWEGAGLYLLRDEIHSLPGTSPLMMSKMTTIYSVPTGETFGRRVGVVVSKEMK